MSANLAQLKKLRGKSLRELRARSRQELAKLSERLLSSTAVEMSDAALLREINPSSRHGSCAGAVAFITERIRASAAPHERASAEWTCFPSLAQRPAIVALMERRFPAERRAIIARAERACAGRFDLLGLIDLSFGEPIDWRLEPLSGKRTPLDHWSQIDYLNPQLAGDKKITWELNRHGHFVTLGQAYWLTGDERYAETFVSQASSWMDANPPSRGINWASSLEVAFRAIAWLWAWHLFASSPHLTAHFRQRWLKHLIAHGRHIESYLSYYFSPNTHLTGEALGLFYLGTALPELRGARGWRELGLHILLEQLPLQVRDDGVYFEQSSYYHRYTADFYTHLVVLARASGVALPREVEQKLGRLLDHLMWLARPDGATPLVGDDDGGRLISLGERRPDDFRDTLAAGAALFGRGTWKFVAGQAAAELLWLLGPEGLARYDRVKPKLPHGHARAFAAAGYFVMRDGWSRDASYALIDSGPHGAPGGGHAHADALAFEFAAAGTTWLVDPGTFTYTSDAQARHEFRSTEAHNTVTVDGEPQSLPAGPFSWSRIAHGSAREFVSGEGESYFEGWHSGYERLADPVTHTRAMLWVKSDAGHHLPTYLIVRDLFAAREHHGYALRYHFPATCRAVAKESQVVATTAGGRELIISSFGAAKLQARVSQGWVSRCYGQREPAPVAVIEAAGKGPQEFATFIIPAASDQAIRVEPLRLAHARACGFGIDAGAARDVVLLGDGLSWVESERLAASGTLAWGRFVNDRLVRACLIRGHALEVINCLTFYSPARVRHCAIQRHPERIAISVRGTTRFDLGWHEPASQIVIDRVSFTVSRSRQSAAFANDGSGWKAVAWISKAGA